jgi:hypothetical protein
MTTPAAANHTRYHPAQQWFPPPPLLAAPRRSAGPLRTCQPLSQPQLEAAVALLLSLLLRHALGLAAAQLPPAALATALAELPPERADACWRPMDARAAMAADSRLHGLLGMPPPESPTLRGWAAGDGEGAPAAAAGRARGSSGGGSAGGGGGGTGVARPLGAGRPESFGLEAAQAGIGFLTWLLEQGAAPAAAQAAAAAAAEPAVGREAAAQAAEGSVPAAGGGAGAGPAPATWVRAAMPCLHALMLHGAQHAQPMRGRYQALLQRLQAADPGAAAQYRLPDRVAMPPPLLAPSAAAPAVRSVPVQVPVPAESAGFAASRGGNTEAGEAIAAILPSLGPMGAASQAVTPPALGRTQQEQQRQQQQRASKGARSDAEEEDSATSSSKGSGAAPSGRATGPRTPAGGDAATQADQARRGGGAPAGCRDAPGATGPWPERQQQSSGAAASSKRSASKPEGRVGTVVGRVLARPEFKAIPNAPPGTQQAILIQLQRLDPADADAGAAGAEGAAAAAAASAAAAAASQASSAAVPRGRPGCVKVAVKPAMPVYAR